MEHTPRIKTIFTTGPCWHAPSLIGSDAMALFYSELSANFSPSAALASFFFQDFANCEGMGIYSFYYYISRN
jgi:hypothetical protein